MKKILLLFLACLVLTSCQVVDTMTSTVAIEQKKSADKTLAMIKCQELCQDGLMGGVDFLVGQCISNEIIPDWVCDIAHSPRQPIDDEPANQCSAFRTGEAHHFVEVDGNCNTIRVY